MKKVLILSAESSKGINTDALSDEFMKGVYHSGNIAEKIFIASKEIKYCKHCNICKNSGTCILNDDMQEIVRKMILSDIIVMATPIFIGTVSARLMALIERTIQNSSEIKNKGFYFILSCEVTDEVSQNAVREFLERYIGVFEDSEEKATMVLNLQLKTVEEYSKIAYDMGLNILNAYY